MFNAVIKMRVNQMNIKNFIKAGLVAGITIIICAVGLVPIVGNEMDSVLAKFNLPPLSGLAMVYFALVSIFIGFALVWLYIILKDRYKTRIKSVLAASLFIWVLAYLLANVSMVVYGFMPVKLTIIGTIWGLLELIAAGLIGSLFYKD